MLVDVVLMRHLGRKITAEAMRAATPMRGHLEFRTKPWRPLPNAPDVPMIFAMLPVDTPEVRILHELRDARVNRWVGEQLVIVGFESSYDFKFGVSRERPQAWWCRLVRE